MKPIAFSLELLSMVSFIVFLFLMGEESVDSTGTDHPTVSGMQVDQ